MIRVGLIGCGFMGGMHAACYQALAELGVKVTAVADVRPEYAKKLAEQCGAQAYSLGMTLIEEADVDVIDICLPTQLHTAHAIAAMHKGRAVFLEKPACVRDEELDQLLAAERETGAKVQVGQVIRFWSEYRWLKQVCAAGTYGRFLCGEFHRLSSLPQWSSEGWLLRPEYSGGVAVDMHVHDVDFVRYLLGDPECVQAQASRDANGLIQQIYAIYGYGNDVGVSIEAGWDYPADYPFNAGFHVKFERAAVINDASGLTVYPLEGKPFHPDLGEEFQAENDIGGNVSSLGGYYNELKFFIEGVRGDHPLDVATLEEAVRSVRLVKKEIEAAGGLIAR